MNGLWVRISDFWTSIFFGAGNSGMTVTNPGPGSFEVRVGALGNPGIARPWWRALFSNSGGVEIQTASSEAFADGMNCISIANQTNANINIEGRGINIDLQNLTGRLCFRNGDGSVELARIECYPGTNGNFTLALSALDNTGVMRRCLYFDPGADPASSAVVNVAGGDHRLRRTPEGNATLA